VRRLELPPEGLDVGKCAEPVLPVVRHPARVVEDHEAERRQLVLEREDLVHLLLVLCDDDRDLRVLPDVGQLAGDRVLVDRHRDAAERLRGHLGPVKPRPVVADDRQLVASLEAERRQTVGEVAHVVVVLEPRVRLPDAPVFLSDGRAVAQVTGVLLEQLRQRRRLSHGRSPAGASSRRDRP